MIVFDNIVFSLQSAGGISVVWYELLKRLLDSDEVELAFYERPSNLGNFFRKKLIIPNNCIIAGKELWIVIERYLNPRIKCREPFVFHSSYFRTCPNKNAINVTTVHDFTYDYYRTGVAKLIHCWQRNMAIRHSDYIVCVSENTKRDLLRFLPDIDESKVRVIYNGVSEDYHILDGEANYSQQPFAKKSYLVFVGSRTGYKNFDLLKKTVAKSPYNLVIVGSKLNSKEEEDLKRYLPKERYCATGFLSNEQLNIVYNNAAALVYPSAYEGFGIPVLEAQRAGCPVIAYNGSSIPEVIGETPLLMNELTEKELLSKIDLLSNRQIVNAVKINGLENSKRFSWDKMYEGYMELYKEALR